jgi:CSLREA domain-containing protein
MSRIAIIIVGAVLALASLEAPTTTAGSIPFTVNHNGDASDTDPGDNFCVVASGHCTLRAAIEEANVASEIHDIHFALPNCPGGGCVINPATPLPALTRDGSRINATTQPGHAGEALVVLDGFGPGGAGNGLALNGSNQLLRGMEIRNFLVGVVVGGVAELGSWEVSLNFIHDNDTGVDALTYCIGNASILGNTITNHLSIGPAIASCGADIEIHFNRIYNNTTGVADTGVSEIANAENNWWGCNEGTLVAGDCDTTTGPVDTDPWLTLDLKAVPASIPGGGVSDLTAMLTENSDGFDTSPFGHVLDGTPVSFATNLGSVGSSFVIKETEGGAAQATLTADEGPGTATITSTVDGETVNTTVIITSAPPSPTPSPSPSPSPTPTPTESPTPSPTPTEPASPTPTDAPTPTPTPTPGPSPTPTPTGPVLVWGDHNCSQGVGAVDALLTLLYDSGQPVDTEECPEFGDPIPGQLIWGDIDCEGNINPIDALQLLRHDAGLPVSQEPGCPELGEEL